MKGDSLISWFHQRDLHVFLDPNENPPVCLKELPPVSVVDHSTQDWIKVFPSVFGSDLGCFKNYVHRIILKKNVVPKVAKVRNVPLLVRESMKCELDKLLKKGIIQEVEATEWVSPVVMARKANGEARLCVDLRELNRPVVVDHYPLPNITEMLCSLEGARHFSSLDLTSAYHQVKLHSVSQDLTAFVTPFRTFKFLRMPFGLISAASVFQRVMESILGVMQSVKVYQDDVLIFGVNLEQHGVRLRSVLKKLQDAGLTLRADKCKFNVEEIEYLGHSVSAAGIKPKIALVNSILNLRTPSSKDELVKFLGMAEFYHKFGPNFAGKTISLRSLLKKGCECVRSKECEEEFICIKKDLNNAPCLSSFDPAKMLYLMTDASSTGLVAVLLQKVDGEEKTVLFISRPLRGAECDYS